MKRLIDVKQEGIVSGLLIEKYIAPPFSVLDTRQGYWQERKRRWLSLGIQSELGRKDKLAFNINYNQYAKEVYGASNKHAKNFQRTETHKTSIFDPVLCEIMYSWFSNEGDAILDPFAGGSVRGIVAGVLNRHYTGIDLSKAQIEANKAQLDEIETAIKPEWITGDSKHIKQLVGDRQFDMIFSCPPYYNLEVYSKDARDLSYQPAYEDFKTAYSNIIVESCDLLKDGAFAVFVVGRVRDPKGPLYNLVGDTITAFLKAGMQLYNDAILVNAIGSATIRAPRQMDKSKKLVNVHQNVLVFRKGA